ncbi:hypothetical protein CR513_23946, partial [Mucuna pruriens]
MVISVVAVEYRIEHVLVDQGSSANILYWSTYQKLKVGSVWADSKVARRCYEDSLRVGSCPPRSVRSVVNILDIDLDPRCRYKHERPHPVEDLKEVQIGPLLVHKTKIGTALDLADEACLVSFLKRNNDVFAWTMDDIPGINPDFICHHLSEAQGAKPIAQKKRKQGEEKQKAA